MVQTNHEYAYDEAEMRTRQKRIVTPGEPQGLKQYHWITGAKENHHLNPEWPSNRQDLVQSQPI